MINSISIAPTSFSCVKYWRTSHKETGEEKMRVAVVVGTRPELIKTWSIVRIIESDPNIDLILIHTGQHYDHEMSQTFFDELSIRNPDYFLDAAGKTVSSLVSKVIERMTEVLGEEEIDIIIVQGDTVSAMAAGLAGALIGIPVGHVEAGCRSYNREMVEEVNRKVLDTVADVLFVPTRTAYTNLLREGGNTGRIFLVGSTTEDALDQAMRFCEDIQSIQEKPYVLVTIHRKENTDNRERLTEILGALTSLPVKCILPIHPRTKKMIGNFKLSGMITTKHIELIEPQNYIQFIKLLADASVVITDSGGVQEEASLLGKTTVTIRSSTEWPETIWQGHNKLVEAERSLIVESVIKALKHSSAIKYEFRNSNVGSKIVGILKNLYEERLLRKKEFQMTLHGYPYVRLVKNNEGPCHMKFDEDGMLTLDDDYKYAICERYKKLEQE